MLNTSILMILIGLVWFIKIVLLNSMFLKCFGKKGMIFVIIFTISEAFFLIFLIEYIKSFLIIKISINS